MTKRIIGAICILMFVSLFIAGCATVERGDKFQPLGYIPKDKATLYIYRPKTFFNWGGWPDIYIDNELKTSLINNSHFICHLKPGEHLIKAEGSTWGTNWYPGPVERKFTFNAGNSYYLRITPIQTGSTKVENTLTQSALINTMLAAARESQGLYLPRWPISITLMEVVEEKTGSIEIHETHQLKQLEHTQES